MVKFCLNKKRVFFFLILLSGGFLGIFAGIIIAVTHDLPQINSLETYRPSSVTRIYSVDKVLLAELYVEKRDPVFLHAIPHYLKTAIISTEDRNFYIHSGVDLKGIARALVKDFIAGEFVEGASTITQQLAKTLFLTTRKTLKRKIKEAFLAFQMERRYTKDEILEMYLNQVYFGSGAYGVESAAKIYFCKSVKELSLAECALIAAMPKAPSVYSPLVNKKLSINRRNLVLKQMQKTRIISIKQYEKAMQEPLRLKNCNRGVKAPYFVDFVIRSLEGSLGNSRIYKGDLSIYTTLSYRLQKEAENAVEKGLADLEKRMKKHGIKEIAPQCALVAIDVKTGGILAMVGGKNYNKSQFNRATNAKRQPGSAFKPIIYAYAIERGFAQNMLILDAPVAYKINNKKQWKPENFSKKYKGEITLRKALAISANIPAIRLTEMLGPVSVAQFAHKLGIESAVSQYLSIALGTSEVNLLELTSVYSVFPNLGKKIKPFGVMEVQDYRQRTVWRVKPQKKFVLSRDAASIVTNMLEGVIKEGTGKKALVLGRRVAGKTGTTDHCKDGLFIGFSPTIVLGVWVGQDKFVSLGKFETGARAALPIWIEFMKKALDKKPYNHFDIPNNVIHAWIDPITGKLSKSDAPDAVKAIFKKGTEPK